jgi:ubiquinone/menaquinone biosynthesis C-methylase UbiE
MGLTPLQRLAHVLRKMRLLQLADTFWFVRMYLESSARNRSFGKEHPDVPVPPLFMLYDIQGSCDVGGYYQSGKEHAAEIGRLISENSPGRELKILEWGCGPARVLRHLRSSDGSHWELYGSDYNPDIVDWCRQHFQDIRFMHNGLQPPVQMESGSVDVLYCISVFTHLSEENHHHWLAEIRRLLKPGGLFIGTFHGAAFRNQLTPEEQRSFDAGELVIRDKIEEGKKNFSAYHNDSVVLRLLGDFDCAKKQEMGDCFRQSVWTARKKAS